jgi:LacI family transcriptional regulator
MGRIAAQALFNRIEGDSGPPRQHWIPTTLIRRGSGELPPRVPIAGERLADSL